MRFDLVDTVDVEERDAGDSVIMQKTSRRFVSHLVVSCRVAAWRLVSCHATLCIFHILNCVIFDNLFSHES